MFTLISIILGIIAVIGFFCFIGMFVNENDSAGACSAVFVVCAAILALCYGCYWMAEEKTQQAAVIANSGHYVTLVSEGKVRNIFVWGPAPK